MHQSKPTTQLHHIIKETHKASVDFLSVKNSLSPLKQLADTNLFRFKLRSAANLLPTPTYIKKRFP
jgi:hypothetical protein